mmetsp:Transcript_100416/g.266935  ORF Transcript_100416/g.266935 Transcript_100416/m.266935 type:complete len:246 (-) Transcript_100416:824-1561(-)
MPSDLTLHFIRINPDFSSFRAHSLTSTISPSFSFLVVSFSFRVASLEPPPSNSKDSVRIVSLTTLKRWPPSSKKTVPWLPAKVIHPSISSFMTFALTRRTSTVSSLVGPSKISTTSPKSSLLRVLLSLMLIPVVMTVSFDTFMNTRMTFTNFSLAMASSLSSSKLVKALRKSSSLISGSSSAALPSSSFLSALGIFSHLLKKAMNSDSSILPSLFVSMSANMSSLLNLLTRLWFLIVSIARFSSA